MSNSSRRPAWDTRTLVTLAMLTAVAYVVMYISKLIPSVIGILDFLIHKDSIAGSSAQIPVYIERSTGHINGAVG